jgi:hypothetical protein
MDTKDLIGNGFGSFLYEQLTHMHTWIENSGFELTHPLLHEAQIDLAHKLGQLAQACEEMGV